MGVTSHRTAGSDLDIVVLLPDGDPQAPQRRPVLHQMVATGTTLLGHPDPWPARCAKVLADGPTLPTGAERERIRYALTDLLDDLVHATDPGERTVIATTAWLSAGQQQLALAGRWVGQGKWLVRDLRTADPDFTYCWLAANGTPGALDDLVREVLDRAGGPLFDGYHAAGERPA